MKKIILVNVFFLFFLFLFLIKIPFTFIADDSPETTTCFQKLLIQHPPGYPFNTMIGKIFSLLPLGNPMMKANFVSCFFHILTSLVLFLLVLKILRNEKEKFIVYVTSLLASVFYLFSGSAFMQAMSAKGSIYTLHSFLVSIIFFSILNVKKDIKYFYLICFVFALSMTNHWPSAVMMIPGIFLYLFLIKPEFNFKKIIYTALFFIIGLTPFLFLFIRSYTNPDMLWPVKNFQDFIWLFGRQQYAGIDTHHTTKDTMIFLKYLFTNILPGQYPFFLIVFALPGLVFLFKYNRRFCLASFAVVLCMISGVASFNIIKEKMEWVVKPYFNFIYLFISAYIAFFFFNIFSFFKNIKIIKIISGILFFIIFFLLYRNFPDYSGYYLAYDYVRNIFKTLPDNSIYFAEGDLNVAGSIYATEVENKKVYLIIPSLLSHKWYRDYLRKSYNIKVDEHFTEHKNCIRNIVLLNPERKFFYSNTFTKKWIDFNLSPKGFIYEISTDYIKTEDKRSNYYLYFKEHVYRGVFDRILYDESTKTFVLNNSGISWYATGGIFEKYNEKINALYYLTRAFNFYKDDILAYKTGLYYYDIENMQKSEYYFKEAIKINKRNIQVLGALVALGVVKNDYNMMRKYAKEILKYDKNNKDAINLLKEIGLQY